MLHLTSNSIIDRTKYIHHLSKLGFVYYDVFELDRYATLMEQQCHTMQYLLNCMVREGSGGLVPVADTKGVHNFLTNFRYVPEGMLVTRTKGEVKKSLSEPVLTKVREKGMAVEFIDLWLKYRSTVSKKGFISSAISKCRETDCKDSHGSDLYKVYHHIKESDNFRTYYNDFSHQQLAKEALTALKAPAGYTLVKGDFAQSDLKILYNMMLRDPSNIDTMYNCKDSYEGIARVVEGLDFDKDKFLVERDIYKENTLASSYGSKSSKTLEGQRISESLRNYFNTLKPYAEFKDRIEKRIECGLPVVVKTFFGNEVLIDSYSKSPVDLLNKALNAPVQAGTSEVVVACGNAIMDRFAEVGVTEENGGIYLYLNRHDELIFLIKNEYMEYSHIFQSCQNILVEGWMPLLIEFSYSDNYAIPNEYIDRQFKSFYKEEEIININKLIEEAKKSKFFIPCDNTLRVAIGYYKDAENNRSIISMVNQDTEKVTYHEVGSINSDEIIHGIKSIINSEAGVLVRNNTTACIAYTDLLLSDSILQGIIPISFKVNFDDSVYRNCMNLARKKYEELSKSEVIGDAELDKPNDEDLSDLMGSLPNTSDIDEALGDFLGM